MERAFRLIKKSKYSREILTDDEIARAVWPAVVGKAIAGHTSRVRLVRTTLVVEVEDAIWQRQLHALTFPILERLRKISGSDAIQDVEFRIGVPRRRAQRAESSGSSIAQSAEVEDEAERIQDPILRRIYQLSRKRAAG